MVIHDPETPETNLRSAAFAAFLCRLGTASGQRVELVSAPADPGTLLNQLAEQGGIVGNGQELHYVPSLSARKFVAEAEDGAWPQSVSSRHRKKIRRVPGAIFRLPLEDAGPDEPTMVEAFVTDWTGLPGSCALAIHSAHPLSAGMEPRETAKFTGRYCRHPLSGDLLPIFVADWVKPDFGTGAVIINPAHNMADLNFSRSVGLPIRFALLPAGHDGAPENWCKPPFIKSGVAVRTGIADDQPFDQARHIYFAAVSDSGLAYAYDDDCVGTFPVGAFDERGVLELPWDVRRNTVGGAGNTVRIAPSILLSALEERTREADLTVVVPSTRVESDLLALRLLLAERNVEPTVENAPSIVVVGGAFVPPSAACDDDVLRVALTIGGGALDTVALKPQQIEPVERFLKIHDELAGCATVVGQALSAEVAKGARQVKDLLDTQNLKLAFTNLYRMQKTLAKSETIGEQDLNCYLVLAYVLTGALAPGVEDNSVDWWQRI